MNLCDVELEGKSSSNPLHFRGPSQAYVESYMRAQEAREKYPEPMELPPKVPGWRTWTMAFSFVVSGIIMFITGAVYYWTSDGSEKHHQGKDLLIVGSVILMPGIYSSYILIGAYLKWKGFNYEQVPTMDEPYFDVNLN